jgi:hypothetical protein
LAPGILARVPGELDELVESVVVRACTRLGFNVERMRGRRTFSIEFGNEAVIDSLPGVPGGSGFVGSFDREEAVENETIDFFASGHPLVEGVLAYFEDSADGRVARLEVEIDAQRGEGIVAIYKEGPSFQVTAIDAAGRPRREWAIAFEQRPLRARRMRDDVAANTVWSAVLRQAGAALDGSRRPYALAAIAVRPLE